MFMSIPFGVRGLPMQRAARHAIKNVDGNVDRLILELKRHGVMVQHASGTFDHNFVVAFKNKVSLRGVGSSELVTNAFVMDTILKIFSQKFTRLSSTRKAPQWWLPCAQPCTKKRFSMENSGKPATCYWVLIWWRVQKFTLPKRKCHFWSIWVTSGWERC